VAAAQHRHKRGHGSSIGGLFARFPSFSGGGSRGNGVAGREDGGEGCVVAVVRMNILIVDALFCVSWLVVIVSLRMPSAEFSQNFIDHPPQMRSQQQQRRMVDLLVHGDTATDERRRSRSSSTLGSPSPSHQSSSSSSLQPQSSQPPSNPSALQEEEGEGPLGGFVFESGADKAAHVRRAGEVVRLVEQCRLGEGKER
jgi:hypothetical protein